MSYWICAYKQNPWSLRTNAHSPPAEYSVCDINENLPCGENITYFFDSHHGDRKTGSLQRPPLQVWIYWSVLTPLLLPVKIRNRLVACEWFCRDVKRSGLIFNPHTGMCMQPQRAGGLQCSSVRLTQFTLHSWRCSLKCVYVCVLVC